MHIGVSVVPANAASPQPISKKAAACIERAAILFSLKHSFDGMLCTNAAQATRKSRGGRFRTIQERNPRMFWTVRWGFSGLLIKQRGTSFCGHTATFSNLYDTIGTMARHLISLLLLLLLISASVGQTGVDGDECLNRMLQADADTSGRLNQTEFVTFADSLRDGVLEDTTFDELPALYQEAFNELACSERVPPENCSEQPSIRIPNLASDNPFELLSLNRICDRTGAAIANYVELSRPPTIQTPPSTPVAPTTPPAESPNSPAPSALSPNRSIPPETAPSAAPTSMAPAGSDTQVSPSSDSSAWKPIVSVLLVLLFLGGAGFGYRKYKASIQPTKTTTIKPFGSAIVEHTGSNSQQDEFDGTTDDEEQVPSPPFSPPSTAAPSDTALVAPPTPKGASMHTSHSNMLPQQWTHEIELDDNDSFDVSTLHDSILLEVGLNNDDETTESSVHLNYDYLGPGSSTDDPSQSQGTTSILSNNTRLGAMMDLEDHDDADSIGQHYGLPGYQMPAAVRPRPQWRRLEVTVPPGLLGMVVDTPDLSCPVVMALKPDSVLVERRVQVGDWLAAVDGEDVTQLSAPQVSNLISEKQHQTRVLTFVRRSR